MGAEQRAPGRAPDATLDDVGTPIDDVGLSDVRADAVMMRTPDGHSRVELTKLRTPAAVRAEPETAPANTLGIRRIMFAVDDIDDVVSAWSGWS